MLFPLPYFWFMSHFSNEEVSKMQIEVTLDLLSLWIRNKHLGPELSGQWCLHYLYGRDKSLPNAKTESHFLCGTHGERQFKAFHGSFHDVRSGKSCSWCLEVLSSVIRVAGPDEDGPSGCTKKRWRNHIKAFIKACWERFNSGVNGISVKSKFRN